MSINQNGLLFSQPYPANVDNRRELLWIGILVAASPLLSFALACAMPLRLLPRSLRRI
jgi:hypothetical protein